MRKSLKCAIDLFRIALHHFARFGREEVTVQRNTYEYDTCPFDNIPGGLPIKCAVYVVSLVGYSSGTSGQDPRADGTV
jgi:hypothetical protein